MFINPAKMSVRMRIRNTLFSTVGLVFASLIASGVSAVAEPESASSETDHRRSAVVAELFTSQSCSSCPSAERLFNKLVEQEGVVAIQWHVDYWDTLVHGRAGKWKDPYSSAANTQRQRDYNYALRGTGSVYTPQAIIGGVSETTGSRARAVAQMIKSAPMADAAIDIQEGISDYIINIAPYSDISSANAETMLITLLLEDANDIEGGENKGLSVKSRNIAVSADMLGEWTGEVESYRAKKMPEGYTCAVIVQERSKGRILGASYCPS